MIILGIMFIIIGVLAYQDKKWIGIISFIVGVLLMIGSVIVAANYEMPEETIKVESEIVSDSTFHIYNNIIIKK